jgi:trans-2,3-dihydro-3-hydroxyanthranilate isomerase
VFEADGLADAAMQAVAREFNLAETIFVQRPQNAAHSARVRIFTPARELPFAGHPTVGCAIALADRRFAGDADMDAIIQLEEEIGVVRCAVTRRAGRAGFAEFVAPKLAEEAGPAATDEACARGLGLTPQEIGFGRHTPTIYSAGVRFCMTPVATPEALARARPSADFAAIGGEAYVYAPLPSDNPHAYRARMFAPLFGITEDPATGSAAAAFAGVVARFEHLAPGAHALPIEQGVEMGRASLIALTVNIVAGALTETRIGGAAVKVSEGVIAV